MVSGVGISTILARGRVLPFAASPGCGRRTVARQASRCVRSAVSIPLQFLDLTIDNSKTVPRRGGSAPLILSLPFGPKVTKKGA